MVLVLQNPAPKTFGVLDVAGTADADDEVSEVISARGAGSAILFRVQPGSLFPIPISQPALRMLVCC